MFINFEISNVKGKNITPSVKKKKNYKYPQKGCATRLIDEIDMPVRLNQANRVTSKFKNLSPEALESSVAKNLSNLLPCCTCIGHICRVSSIRRTVKKVFLLFNT